MEARTRSFRRVVVGAAALAVVAGLAACQPTDPDSAWNGGQPRTFSVQAPDRSSAAAVAPGPGGTTYVAASADTVDPGTGQITTTTSVRRLLADGSPDLAWGTGGRAAVRGAGQLLPTADGGVIAVFVIYTGSPKAPNTFVATRLSATGQKVTAWGTGGEVTGYAGGFIQLPPQSYAVDAQNRLLVAFGANLIRYTTAGLLDATFDGDGTATPTGGALGTVVVAGSSVWVSAAGGQVLPMHDDGSHGTALVPGGGTPPADRVPALASGPSGTVAVAWSEASGARVSRITAAGQLDAAFGTGGLASLPAPWSGGTVPADARFDRIAVDAAGGTVVGWSTVDASRVGGVRLVRATPAGSADGSYGSAGSLVVDGSSSSLPSGASVPGFAASAGLGTPATSGLGILAPVGAGVALITVHDQVALRVTAYDAGGHLATGFGTGGTVDLAQDGPTAVRPERALVLPDGRVVLAVVTTGERVRLVRFTAGGALDTTFGTGGVSDQVGVTQTSWRTNPPTLVAGPNGTVTALVSGTSPVAVRYRADGTRLTTWGTGGRLALPTPPAQAEEPSSPISWSTSAAATADGGLIVAVGQQRVNDVTTPHPAPRLLKVSPSGTVTAQRDLAPAGTYDAAVTWMSAADAQGRVYVVAANGLRRIKADLSNDATFGPEAGRPLPNRLFVPNTVLVGADGKPIVVGWGQDARNDTVVLAVRYTATGGFDPTYGSGGVAQATATATGTSTSISTQGNAADLDLQGRVVVAGSAGAGAVALRFTTAGKLDVAFDGDGVKTWPSAELAPWWAMDIGADGKITLATFASGTSAEVARLEGRPAS
ncbi:hypothetical protein KSP35_06125 [Aquihabitans sp. G128]|uniref:hypothetical protein n=1 Tax=Aquihabitans sp. G128 TaxID=2849779 RepID=UPI001C22FF66|nr:hypothetical protein [Aquihabitans sp. G128]QXC62378.1 hypothetical protein KSP35_06125 [Aquihabitans sp. G128]